MASIFTRIVCGEIPCYKIAETKNCFAFLDINPLSKGHTLVIPKKETDNLFDLDDDLYSELCLLAKKTAVAIGKTISCKKVGVAVVGLEVPHAHIHLVPINGIYDIDFSRPKLKCTQEEFLEIAAKISSAII
ncbi:MAG: HIT family protein [Bacteroidota bacterium]